MRNLFDQYEQPENRLTHALACALSHDRTLLRPFLGWLGIRPIPHLARLRLIEQQVPGEMVSAEEDEAAGLPDLCVFDDEGWAVIFEAKVQSKVTAGQLRRHLATAKRHGNEDASLVVLAVDKPDGRLPRGARHVEWRDLFAWFRSRVPYSFWARQLVEYMQAFENRMIAQEYAIRGTITMFDGFHFDDENPYTYREGKRLIRLLGDEMQARKDLQKIGVDPKGKRRSAITGSGGVRVWDMLPLRVARGAPFTAYPHLTMDIGRDGAGAAVTVPHGVRGGFRTKMREIGPEGFHDLMLELLDRVRPIMRRSRGVKPFAYTLQRHFPSQRSAGIEDGRLTVDLRTIDPRRRARGVRYQPEWIDAAHALLANKRSNIQFGVVVEFSYECPRVRSKEAAGLFAKSWIALSPLIDFVLE